MVDGLVGPMVVLLGSLKVVRTVAMKELMMVVQLVAAKVTSMVASMVQRMVDLKEISRAVKWAC